MLALTIDSARSDWRQAFFFTIINLVLASARTDRAQGDVKLMFRLLYEIILLKLIQFYFINVGIDFMLMELPFPFGDDDCCNSIPYYIGCGASHI